MFEVWAVRLLQPVTNVSWAAELLGLDWHSAWELKIKSVARGLERRQAEPIPTLGMDEKSFGLGQDYATVLTDPAASQVHNFVAGSSRAAAEGP
jgi:transposase